MAAQLHSAPNSQSSSFEHSTVSQSSQHDPTANSEPNSQTLHRETTPSTSLSNPSSQEYMGKKTQHSPPTRAQRMDMQTAQAPIAPMAHTVNDFAGTKRTADGEIKEKSPTSPVAGRYEHSRNSSMTSRGSQIGEVRPFVVFESKTRLKHALAACCIGKHSQNLTPIMIPSSLPSCSVLYPPPIPRPTTNPPLSSPPN